MWSTRACRRTLKAGAGMGVGLTAAAAAQGLYLNSLYKPLPEARGPITGVFRAAQVVAPPFPTRFPASDSAAPTAPRPCQARLPRLQRRASSGLVEYEAPPSEPPQAQPPRKRKILFIGDSLITGVGCSPERDLGPALPRSVAEFVSRHLRQDVEWTALGHTGGNVREIGISQVPRMQAEIARAKAQGECFDAVVVVVGLNDFKRAYRSAQFTAGSFRSELAELVTTIQSAAGKQCTVVLPALPVHRAPVFGGMWPLQPFLETLAGLWDEQKRSLAQGVRRVSFVNHAEGDEWWAADRYWAADGIHPNDEGYRVWGEHIAQAVTQCLRNGSPAHAVTQRST